MWLIPVVIACFGILLIWPISTELDDRGEHDLSAGFAIIGIVLVAFGSPIASYWAGKSEGKRLSVISVTDLPKKIHGGYEVLSYVEEAVGFDPVLSSKISKAKFASIRSGESSEFGRAAP